MIQHKEKVMLTKKFKKSSFCWPLPGCVEARVENKMVLVKDSKNPNGAVLSFNSKEWDAFILAVKAGEFDRPSS